MAQGQADADGRARALSANAADGARHARIDALRALALAGILQVNIQSFTWGGTDPLGYLAAAPDAATRVLLALLAVFVQFKFLPIFALLFGAGLVLLGDKLAAQGLDASRLLARRMRWLLVFGILHGTLLYYGDITNFYAGVGLIAIVFYLHADAGRLRRAAVGWGVAALGVAFTTSMANAWMLAAAGAREQTALDLAGAHQVYSAGSFLEQFTLRADGFVGAVTGFWVFGQWAGVLALMLTGMLAARSGWLQAPAQHPRVVRGALALGLGIGLPCAVVYAWLAPVQTLEQLATAAPAVGLEVLLTASGLLAFAYAAAFLQWAPAGVVDALAPAGRMPLTHYLLQSIAMGALLSGWGLQWGAWMSRGQLALLALALVPLQWMLGAWVMRRWGQGPLEALWRRLTFAGAAARPRPPSA